MDIEREIIKLKQQMRSVSNALVLLAILMVIIPIISLIGGFAGWAEIVLLTSVIQILLAFFLACMAFSLFSDVKSKRASSVGLSDESAYPSLEESQKKVIIRMESQIGRMYRQMSSGTNCVVIENGNVTKLQIFYQSDINLDDLDVFEGLESLTLSNMDLPLFPESVTKLTKLKELILPYNQLTSLPEDIGNLQALERINLQNNSLTSLPESLWSLSNLRSLNVVKNNKLGEIASQLKLLPQLKILYIGKAEYRRLNEEQRAEIDALESKGCEIIKVGIAGM